MNLIILTGKAGSGKDTAAHFIHKHGGHQRYAIAQHLKKMLEVIGFPEPDLREDKEKPYPGKDYSYRKLVQTLGTEWGRVVVDKDFWVDLTLRDITQLMQAGKKAVVTDARYENEVTTLKNLGGVVVKITGRASDLGATASHSSEQLEVVADYVLVNNAGFDHLEQQIEHLLNYGQQSFPF